jgi:hypothetical protein
MGLIPAGLSRQVFRSGLLMQKNAPNLMFAAGIAGAVGSTVLACRATLKLADELPEMKAEIELASKTSDEENPRAVALVYGKNVGRVAQLYAPAVIVGVASVGLLTGSHVTLNKRNAGLTAAYAAMDRAYNEYRDRVRAEVGEDKERDLYRDSSIQKVELAKGKHAEMLVEDPNGVSAYGRIFEESNVNWKPSAELNKYFLHCQQNYFNHLLHARGHVFLNEVYDGLGIERTKAGSVVGWLLDGEGDGHIDFGLFDEKADRFAIGWETNVWLDFNVDGVIYDKI